MHQIFPNDTVPIAKFSPFKIFPALLITLLHMQISIYDMRSTLKFRSSSAFNQSGSKPLCWSRNTRSPLSPNEPDSKIPGHCITVTEPIFHDHLFRDRPRQSTTPTSRQKPAYAWNTTIPSNSSAFILSLPLHFVNTSGKFVLFAFPISNSDSR